MDTVTEQHPEFHVDHDPLPRRIQDAAVDTARAVRSLIRGFLSQRVFPAKGDSAQQEAGVASAQTALDLPAIFISKDDPDDDDAIEKIAASYRVTGDEFRTGLRNLRGAEAAAGGNNRLNLPDPHIPQDTGVAAFFDVDNTLIKGASILLFARGLAKRRFFSTREIMSFVWKQFKFRVSGEHHGDIDSGREQALALVKGRHVSEVTALAEEIWAATIAERIFPDTKELADMHLLAGHEVWLVTASPVQLAQIIARELGFTGALGTVAEVEDGVFTGRMVGDILHGPGKKHAVLALAAHENLDLTRCTAYSDSVNDLPMLSMVGTAVAVNPDSKLRKAAHKNGWDIRDYRRGRQRAAKFGGPAIAALSVVAVAAWWVRR